MRAILAALAALSLLAVPVAAQTGRIAVLYNSGTTNYSYAWINSDSRALEFLYFWKELGLPEPDYFNVGASPVPWGSSPSVQEWFEENYDAIVIPYMPAAVVGGGMENSFSPRWGPLSGRWNIPVYVLSSVNGQWPEDEDSTGTADDLRNGTVITRSRIVPQTNDSLGTHAYKVTSYMRNAYPNGNVAGQIADTLYGGTSPGFSYMSISSPYFPNAYIEPILVIDTTYAGLPAAYANEKLMLAWRWRPDLTKPGVTYCHAWSLINSRSLGILTLLDLIVRDTGIKPTQKLTFAITDHNFGESNNPTLFGQYLDALEDWGMFLHALPHGTPCDYLAEDAASWALGADFLERSLGDWAPYSNQTNCGGSDWTWQVTDTVIARSLYNQMLITATRPDSMGLPMSAYNPVRLSPGSGILNNALLGVAVDIGCEIFDNGLPLPSGSTYSDYAYHRGTAYRAAVRGAGDERRIWIGQTQSVGHPESFAQLKIDMGASTSADARAVWIWATGAEPYSYVRGSSIYWHSDAATGGSDPYFSWMVTHLGRFVASFPNIAQWERRAPLLDRTASR